MGPKSANQRLNVTREGAAVFQQGSNQESMAWIFGFLGFVNPAPPSSNVRIAKEGPGP